MDYYRHGMRRIRSVGYSLVRPLHVNLKVLTMNLWELNRMHGLMPADIVLLHVRQAMARMGCSRARAEGVAEGTALAGSCCHSVVRAAVPALKGNEVGNEHSACITHGNGNAGYTKGVDSAGLSETSISCGFRMHVDMITMSRRRALALQP